MGLFVSLFEYRCPFPHFPLRRSEALSKIVVEYGPQRWSSSGSGFLKEDRYSKRVPTGDFLGLIISITSGTSVSVIAEKLKSRAAS